MKYFLFASLQEHKPSEMLIQVEANTGKQALLVAFNNCLTVHN